MDLFPLENNPEVLNRYTKRLGLENPMLHFVDVYGVSDDLLDMVPKPVFAFLLVYPITPKSETALRRATEEQKEDVENLMKQAPIFFTKQELPNTCGTVALLHALLNNYKEVGKIKEGSLLAEFRKANQCDDARHDPHKMGAIVRDNRLLTAAHSETALEGDTENLPLDANIDLHFTCFVWAWDFCVELDGRKERPILHGICSSHQEFIREAAKAIQQRMRLHACFHSYSITALVPLSA